MRNDNLVIRQYIPPGFYKRYIEINKKCTEARANDSTLKTQLRFGKRDVELFIKFKGEEKPLQTNET